MTKRYNIVGRPRYVPLLKKNTPIRGAFLSDRLADLLRKAKVTLIELDSQGKPIVEKAKEKVEKVIRRSVAPQPIEQTEEAPVEEKKEEAPVKAQEERPVEEAPAPKEKKKTPVKARKKAPTKKKNLLVKRSSLKKLRRRISSASWLKSHKIMV